MRPLDADASDGGQVRRTDRRAQHLRGCRSALLTPRSRSAPTVWRIRSPVALLTVLVHRSHASAIPVSTLRSVHPLQRMVRLVRTVLRTVSLLGSEVVHDGRRLDVSGPTIAVLRERVLRIAAGDIA